MNSLKIQWFTMGVVLLIGAITKANPPAAAPQPCPNPGIPFGYYPTQWRPFPAVFLEPEIRIIMPAERLPEPMPAKSKLVEPAPMKKEEPPADPKAPKSPGFGASPRQLQSPYHPVDIKPLARDPVLPKIGFPASENEDQLQPAGLKPIDDGFRRSDPLSISGEEESEPRTPTAEKPKAWLELPVPFIPPLVRASSHVPDGASKKSSVWRPITPRQ